MRISKKQMVADFPQVSAERELLWLHLCDVQQGRKPDAVETESNKDGKVRVQLWRAASASGGYVVILEGSYPTIMLLDEANRKYADCHTSYSLPLRVCLERVTRARNQALDAKYGEVTA